MSPVQFLGKTILLFGLLLVLLGALLTFAGRVPWLGRLPGDIHLQGKSWSFHFPLATCLLLSVLLSLVLRFFLKP